MDAINGHFELLENSRPIEEVIKENKSTQLTEKLKTFQQARQFAVNEMLLPDNDSYKEYADIGRPYAVWNVIAAPRYSIEPKRWCFMFVGCISYRGYFNKNDAEQYAKQLHEQGYDVYVAGARAYSTLGWFDDPLLNTMMFKSEASRVGILFHELAHQKIYIDDNSDFNEAFASTVEQEGVRRWFTDKNDTVKLDEYEQQLKRKNDFNQLLFATRKKLKELYENQQLTVDVKQQEKELVFKQLNTDYELLKQKWGGYDGYDNWMSNELNNAHMALIATYHKLVPKFKKVLADKQNNLKLFYAAIENLGEEELQKFQE